MKCTYHKPHYVAFSTLYTHYLLSELPKKWSEVRFSLGVGRTGQLALHTSLHVVLSAVQIFGPNTKKKLERKKYVY